MCFGGAVKLGSVLLVTTSALASPPRVHRGPTAPKLFVQRVSPSRPTTRRGPRLGGLVRFWIPQVQTGVLGQIVVGSYAPEATSETSDPTSVDSVHQ